MNAPNKEIFDQLEASRHRNQTDSIVENQEVIDEEAAEDHLDTAGEATGHVRIADNNENTAANTDLIVDNPPMFHKTMGDQAFKQAQQTQRQKLNTSG